MQNSLIYKHRYPASLLILAAIIYLPFLGNDFVFDDLHSLSNVVLEFFATRWRSPRWLPQASLSWTADLFSNAVPHFFHLGNLILHAANAILLFYLLRSLLWVGSALKHEPLESFSLLAWSGAMVFACHPVAVYAAGYISQRSILCATLFGIVMQISYLRGLISGHRRWLFLSIGAYFAAIFCKEHAVMLPAVLVVISILFQPKSKLTVRSQMMTLLAMGAIAIFLVLKIKGIIGAAYEPTMTDNLGQQPLQSTLVDLYPLSIVTQAGLFFKYLFLWILPNPELMSADMREALVPSLFSWQGLAGGLAFSLYGLISLALIFKRGETGLLGFALLYPWLHFIVEFSSVRVQEPFVLYRSYLWMTGWVLIVPLILNRLNKKYFIGVIAVLAVSLIAISWERLHSFSTNYILWDDAAKLITQDTPGADRIYFNRGQAAARSHEWVKAAHDLELAAQINPTLSIIRHELGMAYLNLGKNSEALSQFDAGIRLAPNDGNLFLGKGLAMLRLQRKQEGQALINQACKLGNPTACLLSTDSRQ